MIPKIIHYCWLSDEPFPKKIRGGIHIYPSETFAGNKHEVTPNSFAIHLCAHSWHISPMEKIRKWLGISKRFKRQ